MKYLNDKRRQLTGQQATVQPQAQTVQPRTVTVPQKTQTTAQRPTAAAQTQSAGQRVMEQQSQTRPAETTRTAPAPAQTTTTAPAAQTQQQSDVVAQAQQLISQQLQNFQGGNAGAIDDLMAQIQNREAFTYDVNTDPTYLMLRDIWSRDGGLAMEDTMGQAAQLTGGYGNSYAQTAGQQTYQNYMRGLNEMVPDLKAAARDEYDAETTDLLQRLALLREQDEQEYSRYMDFLAQKYQEGRDAVSDQRYDQEWQYQQEQDALANERYDQEWEYQKEQDERDYMLDLALAAYEMGDDSLVKALGINPQEYGGSYGSGGGGGGDDTPKKIVDDDDGGGDDAPIDQDHAAAGIALGLTGDGGLPKKEDYNTVYANLVMYADYGEPASVLAAYITEARNEGSITYQQYLKLMEQFGDLADSGNSSGGSRGSGSGGPVHNNRYNTLN